MMPFQIVELPNYKPDKNIERKVMPNSFAHRKEAVAMVELAISKYSGSGYEEEQVYWWAKDDAGEVTRFIIEAIE
jgi:hypothetical protein